MMPRAREDGIRGAVTRCLTSTCVWRKISGATDFRRADADFCGWGGARWPDWWVLRRGREAGVRSAAATDSGV